MGPKWGPPGADRTQVGPRWATWTLLSGVFCTNMPYNIFERVEPIICKHRKGWSIVPVPYTFSRNTHVGDLLNFMMALPDMYFNAKPNFVIKLLSDTELAPSHYISGIHRMLIKGFVSPLKLHSYWNYLTTTFRALLYLITLRLSSKRIRQFSQDAMLLIQDNTYKTIIMTS